MTKVAAALGGCGDREISWLEREIGLCGLSFRQPDLLGASGSGNPERFLKIFRCLGEATLELRRGDADADAQTVQK
ncbi:MAG: hypothetical protein EOQ55_28760 [Mesorhizobium sp.]|nr:MULTISPECIES: hypothetical protein [unclassified Mesorhizobium]WIE89999.1 hypothetical protein P9270_020915 [Mesorhizobium sp. WSM4875]MDG4889311.1 hypothetical protein [Mesorhizobium sp. WSM4887]RUV07516.1 hypothetical protein EOA79_04445 [Mesorhizobium sp. M1A.F.Ca.IN.020.03.2.1]RUV43877.1 hypothetical protein EOD29_12350 [Mesorhizobium sp. M1A.T.Ca.IN.004.03.1.1]RUV87841.1 hypothetical protein EOA51_09670 [Mesorhizobium sp. M1A.F.Ca.IN.020.32.1.1]